MTLSLSTLPNGKFWNFADSTQKWKRNIIQNKKFYCVVSITNRTVFIPFIFTPILFIRGNCVNMLKWIHNSVGPTV